MIDERPEECADELGPPPPRVPPPPQVFPDDESIDEQPDTDDDHDDLEKLYEQLSGRSAPYPVEHLRADLQWGTKQLRRHIDLWIMMGELSECEAGVQLTPSPI